MNEGLEVLGAYSTEHAENYSENDSENDSDVTEDFIDGGVFEGSTLEFVELPRTLRTLGSRTFYGCERLAAVQLPEALESISGCCFAHSGLESVEIPAGVAEILEFAFWGCRALRSVKCMQGSRLSKIGERAFY